MTDKVKVGVQCPDCKKRLFSWSTHDYKTCGCPNGTMIDGGDSYLRYGGAVRPLEVLFTEVLDGPDKTYKEKDRFPY